MIEAKCPKCGSINFDEYNSDGGITDRGQITISCICLERDCECNFSLICEIVIKSVTMNE